ncbi:MAG: hypothetical protein K8J08_05535 [Thermoanaerobaculia bacterium]|nr:hypothetical protein [Thermoanaerobaculia bacterium]
MYLSYDPSVTPSPEEWLALSESDRMAAVMTYCEANEAGLPSVHAHAAIHTAVETQIAMGSEIPVEATFLRLLGEGLPRHDAIHAVGMVLSEHMHRLMTSGHPGGDPNVPYYASLAKLTAQAWLASGDAPRSRSKHKEAKKRKKHGR